MIMKPIVERRLLQIAVTLAGIVPVGGGGLGVLYGDDPHLRYLSGLLLGIGLVFWASVPTLERRGTIFRTLAFVVLVGGLARLAGVIQLDDWSQGAALPLVMELGVTPLLALWRERVERRLKR